MDADIAPDIPPEEAAAPPTVKPPEAEVKEAPVMDARAPEASPVPDAAPEGAVSEAAETV